MIENRHKLILLLTVVLATGFLATSFVSYQASKLSIRDAIIDTELPLTADNIYSEIQKDLIRPIFVSSMMASNTFLRDWVLEGEKSPEKISNYLADVQQKYGAFVSFFVSEETKSYYYGKGQLKKISPDEPRDVWYYRVRDMQQPYEINVDKDLAHADALTIFVNYRVLDYDNRYIGATGVGLTVDSVQGLINSYQQRYRRDIYFVGADGTIMLSSGKRQLPGVNLKDIEGLEKLMPRVLSQEKGNYEYAHGGSNHLINVRYLPELKWYLFVEKSEGEATAGIRNTLYINLLICFFVTAIVILLTHLVFRRYQKQLETMATTDSLTGLPNRRAFGVVIDLLFNENMRNKTTTGIILLDIDNFKQVNDKYGHLAGDKVLIDVATVVKSSMRAIDFICRWGGEEMLIVVKNCNEHSIMQLAEKIRLSIEAEATYYNEEKINITASLGAAVTHEGEKIEHVVERADYAMYQAKSLGRNRSVLSSSGEINEGNGAEASNIEDSSAPDQD
jgi:diguanylate cyclase (GGDEF)-like protein